MAYKQRKERMSANKKGNVWLPMANYFPQPKERAKKKKEFPIYALEDPESFGMTEKQVTDLWQHGVDTGIVWHLQGWYGRNAQALLDAGIIKYPKKRTHDYYGNPIPTREEAKK